ncbi:MAG: RNA polymerase factor sigma-54 [Nevskiales bacterium]
MKQIAGLRLGQHLAMTPALQQSIKLLQLSTLDLQQEISQVLEQNFMLERMEDVATASTEADAEPGEDAASNDSEEAGSESDTDWDDEPYANAPAGSQELDDYRQASLHQAPSLHEHLSWQAQLCHFSALELELAEHLIDAVNDNGYLEDWPALQTRLLGMGEVDAEALAGVLAAVQDFDPPGVAARDLAECVTIQLRQTSAEVAGRAEALRLIEAGLLPLVASQNLARIAAQMNCGSDTVQTAVALIQGLQPHPGSAFSRHEAQYVTPEIFVTKRRGRWHASLNPEISPRLRINGEYLALIRRADASPEQQTLKQHLQEARFFLNSLKSRNETLLRVAQCIVEEQRAFLDYGPEAMRPLILRDIAAQLGIHESTVSRATAHKYMATPRGLFELKYFFSSHVQTTAGGTASATAIQAMLKRLIAAEAPDAALSDSRLAELLLKEGVKVARRTVAKYREALDIAPSHERKPAA